MYPLNALTLHKVVVCTSPPLLDETHPSITTTTTWTNYHCDPTTSRLIPVAGGVVPLTISLPHHVSAVGLILNADAKIKHAQQHGWVLSPEVLALKATIDAFIQQFYLQPIPNAENSRRTASDSTITQDGGTGSAQEPMWGGAGAMALDPSSSTMAHGGGMPLAPDRMEETAQGIELDDDGSVYDMDDDKEESDDERTLPADEFWQGLRRLKDPTVPIQDRIDIGSLLFVKQPVRVSSSSRFSALAAGPSILEQHSE
ncbi:hypothetical protein B0H19DRAFT_172264 [Mycena capillaripes]|nr:hypothetical protein B0H19DRAFT_172264 [Mycena capillaripes]